MEFSLFVRQELPNVIRPAKPQAATPQPAISEDNTGYAVVAGRSGQVTELKLTYSANFTRSKQQEKARVVATVRVKQKTKDPDTGAEEVSEENYIDVDVPREVQMVGPNGVDQIYKYAPPINPDYPPTNVEVLKNKVVLPNPEFGTSGSGGGAAPLTARMVGVPTTVKINRRPIRRRQ